MGVISASLADGTSRCAKDKWTWNFDSRQLDRSDLVTIEEAAELQLAEETNLRLSRGEPSGGDENGSAEGTRQRVLRAESELAAERV